ncbi:putative ribonuclease H-like domain-containing protein [Tanacetum coccineum]
MDINGQRVGFNKSNLECYNCHKRGHFARECRFPRNQENKGRENNTRTITVETPTQTALIAQDGIRGYDWSYQAKEEQPTNYALMAFTSSGSSSSSDSEVLKTRCRQLDVALFKEKVAVMAECMEWCKKGSLTETIENKGVSNTVETNDVRMNNFSAPIIDDWNSDDESEIDYTVRPSTEKIKSIKTFKETDAPK